MVIFIISIPWLFSKYFQNILNIKNAFKSTSKIHLQKLEKISNISCSFSVFLQAVDTHVLDLAKIT